MERQVKLVLEPGIQEALHILVRHLAGDAVQTVALLELPAHDELDLDL